MPDPAEPLLRDLLARAERSIRALERAEYPDSATFLSTPRKHADHLLAAMRADPALEEWLAQWIYEHDLYRRAFARAGRPDAYSEKVAALDLADALFGKRP